jgi:hypothetical protein
MVLGREEKKRLGRLGLEKKKRRRWAGEKRRGPK